MDAIKKPPILPALDLKPYELQVYSQHGEDGIIRELCRVTNPMRYFVEFGAEDGRECNTRMLAEQNWRGLQIEAREDCWQDLCAINKPHRSRVRSVRAMVTLDTIDDLFKGVPRNFGVCSIDVDGNDIYLFDYIIQQWEPTVVCVEVNHQKAPHEPFKQRYDAERVWDGSSDDYGASLYSMNEVAQMRGYTFMGCDSTNVNAFYVKVPE